MIRELLEYTETHDLVVRPGYAPKTVKWVIDITDGGQYLTVTRLGDPSIRNNVGLTFPLAPHLEQPELIAGGQTRTQFLIDTVATVTNWAEDKSKTVDKHEAFLAMLALASSAVPELKAWHICLSDPVLLERIREELQTQKAKPTDRITVRCNARFLVSRSDWHRWWDEYRKTLRQHESADATGLCIVTGEVGPIATTHPKISGLSSVGGSAMGSSLVSFDKGAFTSYGLQQGANAPMLERVAVAYQSALNDLIAKGMKLADMRVAYWYRESVNPEDDCLADLGVRSEDGQPGLAQTAQELQALDEARTTLSSIDRKVDATEVGGSASANRFYVLLLSGVAGRVMVRGWYEGAYEELKRNLEQWFSDLSIVRSDNGPPRRLPLFLLLGHLIVRDRTMPAPHVRQLWEAALMARAIPRAVAHTALERMRHDVVQGNVPSEGAAALLKAYVLRTTKGTVNGMHSALNRDEPAVSYQLGRLLAVIDSLQAADGQGSRGTLSSRYFTAASTTPLVVVGRLMRLSPYYLARISSDGLRRWFNNHLIEITNRIPAGTIPRTLTFEEQATFALGYYHQLAHLRSTTQREENN